MIITLKWQCWKVEIEPTLDSVGLWVNAKSGEEWTSPIWLSKLATWNFFMTYTHTHSFNIFNQVVLFGVERSIRCLNIFLVNDSCTSNRFEIFLIKYSFPLKCIETNLVKYSYFGSCPRSEVVIPNCHALNNGDCTDWPLVTWDLGLGSPWEPTLRAA